MFSIGFNVNLFYFYVKFIRRKLLFHKYLLLLPNLFYFFTQYYHSFQTNRIELHLLFFLSPSIYSLYKKAKGKKTFLFFILGKKNYR